MLYAMPRIAALRSAGAGAALVEPFYLRLLALARVGRLRLRCAILKIFFLQHPRNYCLGVGDDVRAVLLYTSLGRHLAYMF